MFPDQTKNPRTDEMRSSGVSVAPNASRVRGKLIGVEKEPEGLGLIWKIWVNESLDVDKLPNFTREYVGKILTMYVPGEARRTIKEADQVEARISFQGDEVSGAFFLVDDDVQKL